MLETNCGKNTFSLYGVHSQTALGAASTIQEREAQLFSGFTVAAPFAPALVAGVGLVAIA